DVEHARDVLAAEPHDGARLPEETADDVRVREGGRAEELHGDLLLELDVLGREDDAHPALTDDALDAVLAGEDLAARQCRLADLDLHAHPDATIRTRMRPELFRLFDVGFPSYFVLLLSGFLFATALGVLWARRIGLNPDVVVDLGLAML